MRAHLDRVIESADALRQHELDVRVFRGVLDQLGEPVDTTRYLVIARRAVEEAAAIRIDDLPLETFDARTRFALFWVRLYGRGLAAKSEARWQAMVSDLALPEIDDLLRDAEGGKGVRLAFGRESRRIIDPTSAVIDIALAMGERNKPLLRDIKLPAQAPVG